MERFVKRRYENIRRYLADLAAGPLAGVANLRVD